MISFNNITKTFKNDFWAQPFYALKDVSLTIKEGAIIGFLGANGAGKTTLIKILMHFITPTQGSVSFTPILGRNLKEVFAQIGFLPERPYFYPHLTGREFVHYLARLHSLSRQDTNLRLTPWAERLKIDHALDRKIKSYSKGMLQRLGVITTMIHDPTLIILDEPLSGLDPVGRKEIKEVISEAHKKGKTLFFSSHIISDVEELCEEIAILREGKLTYSGTIQALLQTLPSSHYNISYYGEPLPSDTWGGHPQLMEPQHHFCSYRIEASVKDLVVNHILQNKGILESLERGKMTLEDIFFHWATKK